MEDAAPTLAMPEGTDLAAYSASLLQRFANPALHHRTWQIAMDGSQKLPQRLLGTMQDRLRLGLPIDTHALAVAGWMRYVTAKDEQGRADRRARSACAGSLLRLPRRAGPVAERLAPALLEVRFDFRRRSAADPRMRSAVTEALAKLYAMGARQGRADISAGIVRHQRGTTAVASISTRAAFSTRRTTCTSAIAG